MSGIVRLYLICSNNCPYLLISVSVLFDIEVIINNLASVRSSVCVEVYSLILSLDFLMSVCVQFGYL